MATNIKFRTALALFLGISVGAMFVNTNILLSMRMLMSKEHLRSMFHDEMHYVMQEYKSSSISGRIKKQDNFLSDQRLREWFDVMEDKGQFKRGDNIDSVPYIFQKNFKPEFTMGLGRINSKNTSVVIGIPSIRRPDDVTYLHDTLRSVIDMMYPVKENTVAIVVFLAERNMDYIRLEAQNIYSNFSRAVDNGLLQIISPPPHFYPNFNRLSQTFGDLPKRLQWRSKEVFDAAYLMFYCRSLGSYYLMLEDDVVAAKGYINALEDFAKKNEENEYVYLALAGFNSIGKLFRSSDIPIWVTYFLNFYGDKPIDWLMNDFLTIKACNPEMDPTKCWLTKEKLKPTLPRGIFQHVGTRSSLDGKLQNILDYEFTSRPVWDNPHQNPTGHVDTSFVMLNHTDAESWYNDGGGMNKHLLIASCTYDDYFRVVYQKPISITKIVVKTGLPNRSASFAEHNAVVEIMSQDDQDEPFEKCADFHANGEAECRLKHFEIRALRIRVTERHPGSVFLRLIFVA